MCTLKSFLETEGAAAANCSMEIQVQDTADHAKTAE